MELFHIISVVVPLVIALFLPRFLPASAARTPKNRVILYTACMLFFISWYLPSPLIDGEDTSFVTHFVGGGIFSGVLFLYIYRVVGLKWPFAARLAGVFALVSTLGALNELFEFTLVKLHIANILLTDTSWDIVANTAGALLAWLIIEVIWRDSWHR